MLRKIVVACVLLSIILALVSICISYGILLVIRRGAIVVLELIALIFLYSLFKHLGFLDFGLRAKLKLVGVILFLFLGIALIAAPVTGQALNAVDFWVCYVREWISLVVVVVTFKVTWYLLEEYDSKKGDDQ